MSQHIASTLSPSGARPPSGTDGVPSYSNHTLDERFEPPSSRPINPTTSETPKPRPLSSNNPYRQLLETSPPVEAVSGISPSTPPRIAETNNRTSPTQPTAPRPSTLPPQQTPAELAALQATANAAQQAPELLSLDRDLIFP
ncbi:hypothetical protein V491_08108, partial [Pseudogymnoascus sp. VKM F-3775]